MDKTMLGKGKCGSSHLLEVLTQTLTELLLVCIYEHTSSERRSRCWHGHHGLLVVSITTLNKRLQTDAELDICWLAKLHVLCCCSFLMYSQLSWSPAQVSAARFYFSMLCTDLCKS